MGKIFDLEFSDNVTFNEILKTIKRIRKNKALS